MTRTEFYMGLGAYVVEKVKPNRQRHGQACWNYLDIVRPDLAERIIGTDADPYDDNTKIREFFVFVEEHWDD